MYFDSQIDNTVKKMVVHVPQNYNRNNKYPLIVLVLANNISYMSESESNCLVYKEILMILRMNHVLSHLFLFVVLRWAVILRYRIF